MWVRNIAKRMRFKIGYLIAAVIVLLLISFCFDFYSINGMKWSADKTTIEVSMKGEWWIKPIGVLLDASFFGVLLFTIYTGILKYRADSIITTFAVEAHEEWRRNFDKVYEETGIPSKKRIKNNTDGSEINIHVPFLELNEEWKRENLLAGKAALLAVERFPNEIESAAAEIHERWMERNPKQEWNAHQHVPYQDLSEEEKEKDRIHAQFILQMLDI